MQREERAYRERRSGCDMKITPKSVNNSNTTTNNNNNSKGTGTVEGWRGYLEDRRFVVSYEEKKKSNALRAP